MTPKNQGRITVIAAIASTDNIVLYTDTGEEVHLRPDEYRTVQIMEIVQPRLDMGRKVTIELRDFSIHRDFEERGSGLVRFFRAAKKSVWGLFGTSPDVISEEKMSYQEYVNAVVIQNQGEGQQVSDELPTIPTAAEIQKVAVETLEANPDARLQNDNINSTETIVAIVTDPVTGEKTAIPGIENLGHQIAQALRASPKGMENFLLRLSSVIRERGHSVEDLLRFIAKADLPIADDGSVIAYKALYKRNSPELGDHFVDCYTRTITQWVGSHVFMAKSMVDPNRRRDCSNGLHICRRDYMGSFFGDVIVICKIAPEDFIAVPEYDGRKVRVCGYHILAQVSRAAFSNIRADVPMTKDPEMAKLLASVLRGDHIGITRTVEVCKGNEIKVSKIAPSAQPTSPMDMSGPSQDVSEAVEALDTSSDIPVTKKADEPLTPKQIRERSQKNREEAAQAKSQGLTADQARAHKLLVENKLSRNEIASACGTSSRTLTRWIEKFGWTDVPPAGTTGNAPSGKAHQPSTKPERSRNVPASPAALVKTTGKTTKADEARYYFNLWKSSGKAEDLQALKDFKKKSKKGWGALGFTAAEQEQITE